ncbi:MAG: hypothetical protein J5501_10375 [Ruminococcus sp.]|nr:hypothetical protein [Ruminococcus sp.]
MYLFQNLKMLWNYLLRTASIYDPETERDVQEIKQPEPERPDQYLFDVRPDYSSEIPQSAVDEEMIKSIEERIDLMNTALTGFRSQWKEKDNQTDTRISVIETRVSETERKNNDYTEFNNRLSVLTTRIDELEQLVNRLPESTVLPEDSVAEEIVKDGETENEQESAAPVVDMDEINKKFKAYGDIYARLTSELKAEREMRLEQESKIETILAVNRKLAEKIAVMEGVEIPVIKEEKKEESVEKTEE